MDYTQLIERLRSNTVGYASLLGKAADAIAALQAQIAEQDHELADTAFLAGQYKAERDAALAKLRELEAQPSPTALELMREYSNGKQWALKEAANICDSTPPHPFRPSIEAAWAIRKLGEGL